MGSKANRQSLGARHIAKYVDSTAEYVPVRRSDFREIAEFGWLEEGAGAAGMFFAAGGFWQLPVIFIEHGSEMKTGHWAWVAACLLSIAFGSVLLWIARRHFKMRDERVNDYLGDSREYPPPLVL